MNSAADSPIKPPTFGKVVFSCYFFILSMIQAATAGCFFIPREKLREYENQTAIYNIKTLSYYDATQQQRYIERQIRRWKREYLMMAAAGQDTYPGQHEAGTVASSGKGFLQTDRP